MLVEFFRETALVSYIITCISHNSELTLALGKREKAKRFIRRLWTPMDEHFAKVLSRLQIHQRLFEDGLLEIYSTEAIIHHNAVDKEMMAHRLHRKHTEIFVLRVDEKLQDLREKLNHNEDAKTELFEKETRGQFSTNGRILIREFYIILACAEISIFYYICCLSSYVPRSIRYIALIFIYSFILGKGSC